MTARREHPVSVNQLVGRTTSLSQMYDAAADAVVVGAGIGGLTAAARLAASGKRVVVLERYRAPGGLVRSWLHPARHEGRLLQFRFDTGGHRISGVRTDGPVSGLLDLLGISSEIEWLRMDQRVILDGQKFDVPPDAESYARLIESLFPGSGRGAVALLQDVRSIFEAMYSEAPAHHGIPRGPKGAEKILTYANRFPTAWRWMKRPFVELLREHIEDARVVQFILGLGGYKSADASSVSVLEMVSLFGYLFFGGYYPRGGVGKLGEVLTKFIRSAGGEVRFLHPTSKIIIRDGRVYGVQLRSGDVIRAPIVISNADLIRTYQDLVGPEHLPESFWARVSALRPACSAFVVHLGLSKVLDGRPLVSVPTSTERGVNILMPSLIDPAAAPEGYSTMEIIQLVPNEETARWFARCPDLSLSAWRRDQAYLRMKKAKGDQLIKLAASVFPNLEDAIVTRTNSSPVTFHRYVSATEGAIYGIDGRGFRTPESPIPGLLLASAGSYAAGVEGAVIAGSLAAELVPIQRVAAA